MSWCSIPSLEAASTCAAALLTGRRYLGIELDAEFHETALAEIGQSEREDRKAVLSCTLSHVAVSVPACPPRFKRSIVTEL